MLQKLINCIIINIITIQHHINVILSYNGICSPTSEYVEDRPHHLARTCCKLWGLAESDLCVCGATQTMYHTVKSRPMTKLDGGLKKLHTADDESVDWLSSYGVYSEPVEQSGTETVQTAQLRWCGMSLSLETTHAFWSWSFTDSPSRLLVGSKDATRPVWRSPWTKATTHRPT